ncbi:unnamed protein product [Onchocerca flexuosa]|uniref:Uncharacterized protein n=1 Tax=Onchocerca flexuosa TaxID=387005 RepID=A0A183H9S1_9BILA|nr:unnamed protein product [Onchocerca flexuosa]
MMHVYIDSSSSWSKFLRINDRGRIIQKVCLSCEVNKISNELNRKRGRERKKKKEGKVGAVEDITVKSNRIFKYYKGEPFQAKKGNKQINDD